MVQPVATPHDPRVPMLTRLLFLLALTAPLVAQQRPLAGPVRDLRTEIDFERIGSFHLGPTGAMGWMHVSPNFMTREARQILITEPVARRLSEPLDDLGRHPLRGLARPAAIFSPRQVGSTG